MTYYQKYLKYKKKYLDLIRGGGIEENKKFLEKYYYDHKYKKEYNLRRYIDGGSDHYVLHTEIDNIIYISFNIKQKIKKNEILKGKQIIDINLTELKRVDIIIENLNFLIHKLNPHGIKTIIINIQECFQSAYVKLKDNLICQNTKFSYTELFACNIFIAYRKKEESENFVGLDNNWLYGKDNDGKSTFTGINGKGNTEDNSCLCTFIYDTRSVEPTHLDAERAFMATKIWEQNDFNINTGSYEFITKAIFIPKYNIFNVHFDGGNNDELNCTNFIEKFNNLIKTPDLDIFRINHIAPTTNSEILGCYLQNNKDYMYESANFFLSNYEDTMKSYKEQEQIQMFHETPAYDYINKKLDAKYNNKITINFNEPYYILGDFNINPNPNPNDPNDQMHKFNDFKSQNILEEISVKYKFYTDDNTDAKWNLDRMIQMPTNNRISKVKVKADKKELKEKEKEEEYNDGKRPSKSEHRKENDIRKKRVY